MYWLRWVHISRGRRRREFRRAVARARPTSLAVRPPGSCRMSSSSSSWTAFSATGFLFLFLMGSTSIVPFKWLSESLLLIDVKPGPGSTRIIALGPSSGWRPIVSCVRASRRVSCLLSRIKQEAVKDVVHSRSTRINWRLCSSEGDAYNFWGIVRGLRDRWVGKGEGPFGTDGGMDGWA